MDRTTKIATILGIALISFSVFYYLVIFLPHKEQAKINLQKQAQELKQKEAKEKREAEEQKQIDMENELDAAFEDYKDRWDSTAKRLGSKNGTLPDNLANAYDKAYHDTKKEILRKYGK